MARRKRQEEEVEEQESGSERSVVSRQTIHTAVRFTFWTLSLVICVFAVAWVTLQGEQFLSTDARFRVPRRGATARDAGIEVRGLKNASKAAVLRVFENDRGRSLADVDPDRRRLQLRTVDWVRDASVRRIWPNHLDVEVTEREPVAFVQVASGFTGSFDNPVTYKPMLIDADGVILRLRGSVPANLPLLTGVRLTEDVEIRRARVLRMLRLLDELREFRDRIPEIDVSDPESVRMTYQMQNQQVILILGNERFLERLNIFLRHYDGIRERLPARAILDVSLEGRITAIEPVDGPSGK
ncbi:FtsQ-type POTRA domain-containing protein [uncultured Paludibaculum sp.]|uniref:cell division protein FtsQ/DivIB n=1 Tax=uncultured Paludibaculum sp. TaxID=1765020 RepID=UPI002AAC456A|nr:FtsQ-type POTRA domain-containing protein [uncultured Paludibaculum sp.]